MSRKRPDTASAPSVGKKQPSENLPRVKADAGHSSFGRQFPKSAFIEKVVTAILSIVTIFAFSRFLEPSEEQVSSYLKTKIGYQKAEERPTQPEATPTVFHIMANIAHEGTGKTTILSFKICLTPDSNVHRSHDQGYGHNNSNFNHYRSQYSNEV